ncbi:MAG: DEAD/DEAH box helicase [Synechococcus sp. SB0665_bin_28]|nr:DEAD/DEAH box helicase [Synechococcus sp. SB0665_bin_28]MYF20286.1 DEAD/DEAH box helicase [Synechococcus sp. SB0677_bin_5]
MSLLHALWDGDGLVLWANGWRLADRQTPVEEPLVHPFALSRQELRHCLSNRQCLPQAPLKPVERLLSLPSRDLRRSRRRRSRSRNSSASEWEVWSGLPLLAGEAIPEQCQWWPWRIEGLKLAMADLPRWLGGLPLSGEHPDLGDELRWLAHLQRWCLSLMARGRWLPVVEAAGDHCHARWQPLLNREDDRYRLETMALHMPQVLLSGHDPLNTLACRRPEQQRLQVAGIVGALLDTQMRVAFTPLEEGLGDLLDSWQQALASTDGLLNSDGDGVERLQGATNHWRQGVTGQLAPARACLELQAPTPQQATTTKQGEEDHNHWQLRLGLQAAIDPGLWLAAEAIWAAGDNAVHIGEIPVEKPSQLLLEGLGRALSAFEPLERGLEGATPSSMSLTPAEAFVLVRTASRRLRDLGVGVKLPATLSGGLAGRMGLAIQADLPPESRGFSLGESLQWRWTLMIGGQPITLNQLERLSAQKSPLVNHGGQWVELRPGDVKAAEKFCLEEPRFSLEDALRLAGNNLETLQRLPVHRFEAGPRLQQVLEQYHHHKQPDPLPAPEGFRGQLRPYQERGLGWLAFLYRFGQGACLADDMGLGKTIQLLAFLQYLKVQKELKRPVLLACPTSVMTNWRREAQQFTPELRVIEHYGSRRPNTAAALAAALNGVDLVLTSYGLLQRDLAILGSYGWQGVVIDEAQAIKNPASKQSAAARELSRLGRKPCFCIALTGTPVENRVGEIWPLMNFLNPQVLGEEGFFRQRYRLPIERYGDMSSLRDLRRRVGPFILRRLKTDQSIISDLPEKIEINEWCGLSDEQRRLYSKTVDETFEAVARAPRGERHGRVLGLLTKLKQICNHPALVLQEQEVSRDFARRSAKLQRLEEILDELMAVGDRALLFTQFARWGHLLKKYLEQRFRGEVPFLHGGSSKAERQGMVDRFQQDPRGPQLFLLSLKAGGVGLNLTRASHVVHIDRWWNPAVENQATDRAYRIGQTNRVMVHKFITSGSLEENVDRMIREKARLAEDIIGGGEDWLAGLAIDDIKDLVSLT